MSEPWDEELLAFVKILRRQEPSIRRVFRVTMPAAFWTRSRRFCASGWSSPPVPALLLINGETPASGIVPVYLPNGYVVIDVTPDEFARLGVDLHFPDGWTLGEEL